MRTPQRALLFLSCAAAACFSIAAFLRARVFAVAVAGDSMRPAFEPGDYVFVRRARIARDVSAAGLPVCVRGPDARLLLKRIVGVPGDSLRIGTTVQVGGQALIEPYASGATPASQFRGVRQLAADEYLVLGDNRSASTDSRDFGPVGAGQIEGIAWFRYWPPERVGLVPRAVRRFAGPDTREPGFARADLPSPSP
jgi:signal peptidase I